MSKQKKKNKRIKELIETKYCALKTFLGVDNIHSFYLVTHSISTCLTFDASSSLTTLASFILFLKDDEERGNSAVFGFLVLFYILTSEAF